MAAAKCKAGKKQGAFSPPMRVLHGSLAFEALLDHPPASYLLCSAAKSCAKRWSKTVRTSRTAIRNLIDIVGSAINAAGAVEGNRAPKGNDLRRLGIDPVEFAKIRRI